jgi:pseudouridine-5'-phosphate glycosidase
MAGTLLQFGAEVATALRDGQPLVALESTVISHGLPRPTNWELGKRLESIVRLEGSVPATMAILDGQLRAGLDEHGLARLAFSERVAKVSLRDFAPVVSRGGHGATTVAGTAWMAWKAGIRVFSTGGIGGVHRGSLPDVSADLPAIASIPVAIVCAGAKAVLDLPATREWLETHGVPVLGIGTHDFPAFYSSSSGLAVDFRADSAEEAASVIARHWALGLTTGVLVTVPVPPEHALPFLEVENGVRRALRMAEIRGISGKEITPFLLGEIANLTGGASLRANLALLEQNARFAARLARALQDADYPPLSLGSSR